MRTYFFALLFVAAPLRAQVVSQGPVQPVHPLVMAVQSSPSLRQGIEVFQWGFRSQPERFLNGAAYVAATTPPDQHAIPARGPVVAIIALAARPELIEEVRESVGAPTADWLQSTSQALHRLAQEDPRKWGRALAQAKSLEFTAGEDLSRIGGKLGRIFDQSAPSAFQSPIR